MGKKEEFDKGKIGVKTASIQNHISKILQAEFVTRVLQQTMFFVSLSMPVYTQLSKSMEC